MSNLFDSANAPIGEPKELVIGDRIQWKRTDLGSDYDNATYTLKYAARLAGEGSTEIEITAVADGSDYLATVAASASAAWEKGTYYWQAYIVRDSDSERISVDRGVFDVIANLDADKSDPRSHARIMLSKIESILENRADSDVDNYAIAGRSITKMSVDELMKWKSHYESRVQAEDDKIARERGETTGNTIQMRFV